MSEKEWGRVTPSSVRAAYWHERVFIAADTAGYVLSIANAGGARDPSIVTHGVNASAWYSDARTPLKLALPNTQQVYSWGEGAPLQWTWQSEHQVQEGLWRPSSIKVVSLSSFRGHHDLTEAANLFKSWDGDKELFFARYPEYNYLRTKLLGSKTLRVELLCDCRVVDSFAYPSGNTTVKEVHLQTSHSDLAQEGGAA
jgi:hypothetical protein